MNRAEIINLLSIIAALLMFYYFYTITNNVDTKISNIKAQIELREQQNDSISKKLDSIAVKKTEIVNRIDNRKTTINNLFNDIKYSKPKYDTSLSAAVLYLKEFSNKQY
jgi:uncharacterized protein YoxC